MASQLEYVLLAANVYGDSTQVRSAINTLPIPVGWSALGSPRVLWDGFMASAYSNGSEIVISYAGTTDENILDWVTGNVPAATATFLAPQILDAAKFYLDIRNQYPGQTVSFTGHSLGGGLASLMAVYFDKEATVFDEAPFQKSADSLNMVNDLKRMLLLSGYSLPSEFLSYIAVDPSGATLPSPTRLARQYHVHQTYVTGEVLSLAGPLLTNLVSAVLSLINPKMWLIGGGVDKITDGNPQAIDPQAQTNLGWGWSYVPTVNGDPVALHSVSLLAGFLQSPDFLEAVQDYQQLLPRIFKGIYPNAPKDGQNANMLDLLVQRQYRGEGALDVLAADVQKIDDGTGLMSVTELTDPNGAAQQICVAAIIMDAAIASLYAQGKTRPQGSFVAQMNELLQEVAGGLTADLQPLGSEAAKVEQELQTLVGLLVGDEASHATFAKAARWTLQNGSDSLDASFGDARGDDIIGYDQDDVLDGGGGDDNLVGFDGADDLDGGDGGDMLFGGDGDDTLDGGANGDYLYGGDGDDRYDLTGGELFDIITDADGNGSIWVDGQQLTGGKKRADDYWISDDSEWGYLLTSSGDLVISKGSSLDRITIRDWQANGGSKLGIVLDDAEAPHPEPNHTFNGDFKKKEDESQQHYLIGDDGNYIADDSQPGALDLITGTADADIMDGLAGDDALLGRGGDDSIQGGDGNDVLQGGMGADTLEGGAGRDLFYGSSNGALVYPTATDYQFVETNPPITLGQGFDWRMSTYGPDSEGFDAGYLTNTVSRDQQAGDDGNVIDGGAGNDVIFAGSGDDIAHGGDDRDEILGMGGEDALYGDGGDDRIYGDSHANFIADSVVWTPADQHSNDYIDGGDGNDILLGQGKDDELYGGDGNDLMLGDDRDSVMTPVDIHGNDYLDGEGGDDSIAGGARDDELFGGQGNDALWGDSGVLQAGADGYFDPSFHGKDYLDGEEGDDQLVGEGNDDELFGGAGDDALFGDDDVTAAEFHGDDYLDGEDGDDYLEGNGGADTLFGGAGADELHGDDAQLAGDDHGDDYLDGEGGNDTLVADGGNDDLFGGDGDDFLRGDADSGLAGEFHGDDYLDGEAGNDDLVGNGGGDTLFGGSGNDSLFGDGSVDAQYQGNDYLDGEDGVDQLVGDGGADTLLGGDGDDLLFGDSDQLAVSSHGNDYLDGGAGNDQLRGFGGNDLMDGNVGNDSLWGETGNDSLAGGQGDDQLQGGDDADVLSGDEGADFLLGDAGNDDLYGGGDNDRLQAGADNDRLFGDDGADIMFGEAGDDYLDGGNGDDTMIGGLGNDTLVGDVGFDYLQGNEGDDTYVFNGGDTSQGPALAEFVDDTLGTNHIRLNNGPITGMTLTPDSALGANVMRLDTAQGTVFIRGYSTGAIGSVNVSGTTYTNNQFFGQTYAWAADQTTSTAGATLQGGKVGDSLTSTGGGATLAGGAGNDTLTASGGNNTYLYNLGDGVDTITDNSSAAQKGTLVFGSGIVPQDLVLSYSGSTLVITFGPDKPGAVRINGFTADNAAATAGIATFRFNDGTQLTQAQLVARGFDIAGTAGGETVTGTNLVDRITGGAGNDTLTGKAGADTYTFNIGDGTDTVADGDTAAGAGDTLRFGAGIVAADIRALRNGNDVSLIAGSDQVTLKNYFGTGADVVENIVFADGTQWTQADVQAVVTAGQSQNWLINGDAGNNTLRGLGGNDTINGLAGDDTIFGATGNDIITGGSGYDMLYGQAGGDTYVVAPGADRDTVDERDSGEAAGVDTIRFEGGINRANVNFASSGNDLYVQGNGSTAWFEAVVAGQYSADSAANQVERFEFSDGSSMTAQEVKAFLLRSSAGGDWIPGFDTADAISGGAGRDTLIGAGGADTLSGDDGDDQLYGDAGDDQVQGGNGDDVLYGADGNDTFTGGAGWDRLDGGAGNDTYTFGTGQGSDIIVADASGTDTVQLAAGLTASNVTLHRISSPPASDITFKGDSLVIQLNGGSDQLWIANYFDPAAPGAIENVRLGDGTTWDYAAVTSRLATLGGTANTQTGTTKANTFAIDHWSDVVNDPSATDVDTATASVSWRLPDNVNNLTLTGTLNLFGSGGASTDTLRGNAGDNRFDFMAGSGSDSMLGGKGNDIYTVRGASQDVNPNEDPLNRGGAVITELAGEGTDTMVSGFWSAQLPDNVENLVMTNGNSMGSNFYYNTNSASIYTHRLIGNTLDNVIDSTVYEQSASSQKWYAYRNYPNFIGLLDFRLDGGAGADTLVGGRWNDTYVIDNAGDTVVETGVDKDGFDSSNDTVETAFATSLATQFPNIENVTLVGAAAVAATGNARANRLSGALNSAANVLTGGAGDDTYVVGAGDTVVEQAGEGSDTLVATAGTAGVVRLSNYLNVEHVRLQGDAGNLDAEGDAGANQLTGSLGNNNLWGGDGDDALADQFLDDILYVGKSSTVEARPAADADVLYGGTGNDSLSSRGGTDTLDGGAGDDSLRIYYASRATVVRFGLGDGHDVLSQDSGTVVDVTVELKAGIDPLGVQLTRAGGLVSVHLADGSVLDIPDTDTLRLKFADGMVLAGAQIDAMLRTTDRTTPTELGDLLFGTGGADSIAALGGDDAVFAGDGADTVDTGAGSDLAFGGTGNDTLTGGGGNDTLAGGTGADTYRFSAGFGQDVVDDTYTGGAASATDDGAVDTVQFDATVPAASVAVYRQVNGTTPSGLVVAVPSTGDSVAIQNAYAPGGAGAVEFVRFSDGTQWDIATLKTKISGEIGYEGADTLTAPVLNSRLEGRGGNDTMTGGAGNDTLDGGAGIDQMTGGAGNDTFYVDSVSDSVIEASKGGTDTVVSSVDGYTLAAEVERGQLVAGTAALRLYGNALVNTLIGNAGDNTLSGGAGNDSMTGGAGNDLYVVDASGDLVTELDGEGTDSVESAVTYTLGNFVENLTLTGSSKIGGTGNGLDNVIVGNGLANSLSGGVGNDRLDGGAGNDALSGGAGNDTFVVDSATDTTTEAAAGGVDTVETALAWTLGTEIERLVLTGTGVVNGTGNASANWLVGNSAANTLNGLAGADVLLGGVGNDTVQDTAGNGALEGGAGNDTLAGGIGNDLLAGGTGTDTLTLGGGADIVSFNRGDGADTINAPVSGAGLGETNDTLSLGKTRIADVTLSRETNDLVLKVAGTADSLRFKDWYLAAGDRTFTRLQVLVDSSTDYAPGGSDPLRNARVATVNFTQLVAAYDTARASNPSLVNWAPPESTWQGARLSSSDSLAYGGNLAYRYGQDGTLGLVQYENGTTQLASASFGTAAQDILLGAGAQAQVFSPAAVSSLTQAEVQDSGATMTVAGGDAGDAAVQAAPSGNGLAVLQPGAMLAEPLAAPQPGAGNGNGNGGTPSDGHGVTPPPVVLPPAVPAWVPVDWTKLYQTPITTLPLAPTVSLKTDLWSDVDVWSRFDQILDNAGLNNGLGGDEAIPVGSAMLGGGSAAGSTGASSTGGSLQTSIARIEEVTQLNLAGLN